ncbi:hypothetical protein BKA62DRAFT_675521 [Auriculariales sp. MPI-PUGE-AT-0066]|nr:hypothetical protein BKA62DRAFT_675521 [Auriculariales sp. MPI-PUGE-AT-0066]
MKSYIFALLATAAVALGAVVQLPLNSNPCTCPVNKKGVVCKSPETRTSIYTCFYNWDGESETCAYNRDLVLHASNDQSVRVNLCAAVLDTDLQMYRVTSSRDHSNVRCRKIEHSTATWQSAKDECKPMQLRDARYHAAATELHPNLSARLAHERLDNGIRADD